MQKFKTRYQLIICLLLCCCLCGCGLQLRRDPVLPPTLHHLNLQSNSPYSQFTLTLRQRLIQNNVVLATTSTAPITLNILHTHFKATSPSYSTTNQASVYQYTYTVNFALVTTKGHHVAGPYTVSLTRTLIVNAGETLFSTDAVNRLETQMIADAITQMMLILGAPNTQHALASGHHETNTRTT